MDLETRRRKASVWWCVPCACGVKKVKALMLTARLSRQTPVKKLTHPRHHHAAPLRLLPPPPPPPVIKRVGVSIIKHSNPSPHPQLATNHHHRRTNPRAPESHTAPRAAPLRPRPRVPCSAPRLRIRFTFTWRRRPRFTPPPSPGSRRTQAPACVRVLRPLSLSSSSVKKEKKNREEEAFLTAVLSGVVKKSPTRVQIQVTAVDRDRGGSEVVAGSEREEEGDIEGRSDPEASGGRAAKPAADGGVGAVVAISRTPFPVQAAPLFPYLSPPDYYPAAAAPALLGGSEGQLISGRRRRRHEAAEVVRR